MTTYDEALGNLTGACLSRILSCWLAAHEKTRMPVDANSTGLVYVKT